MRPWLLALLTLAPALAARVPAGFMPGRMASLELELERGPWQPQLAAEYGVGLALRGQCHLAVAYLEPSTAPQAQNALAGCLARTGSPEQGFSLREEGLRSRSQGQGLTLLELAEDQLLLGDLPAVEDTLAWTDAWIPDSRRAMALHAELAIAQGDLDAAQGWLQLASDQGGLLPVECLQAQARLGLRQGDLAEAGVLLDVARDRPRRVSQTAALTAELLVLQGDPAGAVALLERPRWDHDYSPELVAARVQAWEALGEPAEAAAWRALLDTQLGL